MAASGLAVGSLAFNKALAMLIATIIVAVIMFAIALIPVIGPLIVALVAAIDAVIDLICKAAGVEDEDDGRERHCDLHAYSTMFPS